MNTRAAILSLAVAAGTAASAQPAKVGIIHIQNAIISTKDGQKAAGELESKSAPKKKELEKRQGEIASLRDQLNKIGNTGSEEQKQRLMRDIDTRTKAFNRDVEDAQAELDQDQSKVLNELGGRIMAVIDKYAKDNGYAVVLDVSNQQTPVIWASDAVDITKEIVALYDKNAPAATSAAPPPTGGVASPAVSKPAPVRPSPSPAAPAAKTPAAPPKPAGAK